jgi:hypothetical protein
VVVAVDVFLVVCVCGANKTTTKKKSTCETEAKPNLTRRQMIQQQTKQRSDDAQLQRQAAHTRKKARRVHRVAFSHPLFLSSSKKISLQQTRHTAKSE